jgi:hypothetical protein
MYWVGQWGVGGYYSIFIHPRNNLVCEGTASMPDRIFVHPTKTADPLEHCFFCLPSSFPSAISHEHGHTHNRLHSLYASNAF